MACVCVASCRVPVPKPRQPDRLLSVLCVRGWCTLPRVFLFQTIAGGKKAETPLKTNVGASASNKLFKDIRGEDHAKTCLLFECNMINTIRFQSHCLVSNFPTYRLNSSSRDKCRGAAFLVGLQKSAFCKHILRNYRKSH